MAKIAYLSFLEALLIAFRANNRTYSLLHPSFLTLMVPLSLPRTPLTMRRAQASTRSNCTLWPQA